MELKKGDAVMIIAGKDKGKSGVIVKAMPKDGKVIVEGLNMVSKAKKARTAQDRSEIIQIAAPIEASNVMIVCGECDKVTRIAHKTEETNGKKKHVRICKKCGASLDTVRATKAKSAAKKAAKKKAVKKTEEETAGSEE